MTSNKIDCKAFKVNILNKVYDINLMVISARSDSIISHNVVDADFITFVRRNCLVAIYNHWIPR